jgi:hypothetical protein
MENNITNINDTQLSNGYLQDINGNKCTRRLFGMIIITLGIIMAVGLFIRGLYDATDSFISSYNVCQMMLLTGSGLLGINIIENLNIFNKIKG